MKRVAFFTNSMDGGGAERIVATLGGYFNNHREIDSRVVIFEDNDFYSSDDKFKIDRIARFDGGLSTVVKLLLIPILAFKLKSYVKRNNIDLVQSHLYRANYINTLSKLLGSKHEVQIVNHDNFFKKLGNKTNERLNLNLIKTLYGSSDKIIAISEDMKDGLEELLGKRVDKINNPYDIEKIREMSMEYVEGLSDDRKYISSMGRLISLKRFEDIIEAYSEIAKKYTEYDLLVIGDGPEKQRLIELVNIFGLKGRVKFIGRIENPFKYLKRSEIFVLASETEGFPNSLIEAMACGCQIISSDCISGPREILAPDLSTRVEQLTHGKRGILYPVGDVKELTFGMETLIRSKIEFDVENRAMDFDTNIIMKKYEEVLLNG